HHHISMYTKNAKKNKDFYTQELGLRLAEKSVNQDNPKIYHLFFGDEIGSSGTLLSFFEIPLLCNNCPVTNSIHRLSILIIDYHHFSLTKIVDTSVRIDSCILVNL